VVTVASGTKVVVSTVTAATPTRSLTKFAVVTNTVIKTVAKTITFTSTILPSASVTACRQLGGRLQ
jgi:hypothetical protein